MAIQHKQNATHIEVFTINECDGTREYSRPLFFYCDLDGVSLDDAEKELIEAEIIKYFDEDEGMYWSHRDTKISFDKCHPERSLLSVRDPISNYITKTMTYAEII